MSTIVHYPHLRFDADGTARVGETRYKVIHLAGEHYHYGWTAEEILRQHPYLRPEQVYASLTYFYDHHESMVRELMEREAAAEAARDASAPGLSRAELLKRRADRGA